MGSRDFVGYGGCGMDPRWPNNAVIAVQFVINYEEGGENNILDGDGQSEHLLSEIIGATPYPNQRHLNMESIYEYGSRAGFWRLHRLFTDQQIPCTVFGVGLAMEKNPEAVKAMVYAGWEIASHGYRWIDYQNVEKDIEREHINKTIKVHEALTGKRPKGIYQGKPNCNTRKLIAEEGGFLYDSDAYNDDLPYWTYPLKPDNMTPHLVIPYTLCNNDMRFVSPQGFNSGDQFFTYLRDAFDVLMTEGRQGNPKMMSIGLHCRIVGQPGRIKALAAFIDYVKQFEDVWICRRIDIAKHWYETHYPCQTNVEDMD